MIFTISWSDLYTKISKHVIEKYLIIGPYCPPFNAARNKTLLEACSSALELVEVSWTAWAVFVLLRFRKYVP